MSLWRFMQVIGLFFLIIVLLTHVAERLHVFPGMGWGLPNSVGHYLDLVTAILAGILLPLGFLGELLREHKR